MNTSIDDDAQRNAQSRYDNHGFTATEFKILAMEWIRGGGEIRCNEAQPQWKDRRDYYYYIVINGIDEFPNGLFIEMELTDADETDPQVSIVNAHPASFRMD